MESENHSRINLKELKLQMEKQAGPAPTRQYFSYLNGLLSKKLTKPQFDKLCILTLGQENLFLHNQLIRSVFQNACQQRFGKPDQSLEPAPPVWCSGSVVPIRENGQLDNIGDFKHLVKRPRVDEHNIPLPVPVPTPRAIPVSVSVPVRPSTRKVRASRSFSKGEFLASNEELKRRLDNIARENGLEGGATPECAQLLNSGLDLHLRQVITSCLDLVHSQGSHMNAVRNGAISIQDFRVAMEMNPQQLGRNYPLLLDKLSSLVAVEISPQMSPINKMKTLLTFCLKFMA
ncbi:hypothetical protein LUZ61_008325 [Rhynchospora tenuis]|uniref:Uncharacterized protein n=1 Tax=Rhynchospora tenuis TaxID=198213 RepID=A0AAD6EXI4_9POAL|nr:hypothetical protein LUZ61_008325 [Rhynchospora tenuis]